MEDKKLRLKQLAEEILSIVNEQEQPESQEHEQMEEPDSSPKELKKAALVAKLKKQLPQE